VLVVAGCEWGGGGGHWWGVGCSWNAFLL
jgi:hypothetical protein